MGVLSKVNRVLAPVGVMVTRTPPPAPPQEEPDPEEIPRVYSEDGLTTIHNHEFMDDPAFLRAYRRGVAAAGKDYAWHWRVHVGLWVASNARELGGDFVECGVNRGCLSSAIMEYLDWNSYGRTFYLLDTFSGLDERFVSEADKEYGVLDRNQKFKEIGFYSADVDQVRANFAEWENVRIIQGAIPETLGRIDSDRIAYAHLDMNCAKPEVEAADYLWDRLLPGAMILLDDYAYHGYRSQKVAMDEFARSRGIAILSMPTGQGLIVKPSDRRDAP